MVRLTEPISTAPQVSSGGGPQGHRGDPWPDIPTIGFVFPHNYTMLYFAPKIENVFCFKWVLSFKEMRLV